jgi:CheY-like chemotaxis protein/prolyl-tRNA editing enzyme YbaK/EbsC (Cys-tRNA(Pro) deacylase)
MALPRWLSRILDHHRIPYEVHRHPPVFSASHLAHAEHVSGHRVAKTVFLNGGGRPLMVVLPACDRLDLGRVQAVLGRPDLRFASEAEIEGWFKGCQPGSVPPLRLRADQGILMDRALAHLGTMLFAAGSPEEAIAVRFRDWYRAVRPGIGRFCAAVNGHNGANAAPTVLVVEDEAETNELFCRLMEREGYTCQGVEEGNRALEVAAEVRPSAILLDLMLPDMSGFDVCERLRRNGPLKRIPVIVMTALDDEASRQRGRELGAEAYLTKPFAPSELVEELHEVLADCRA